MVVRTQGRVRRERFASGAEALEALEAAGRELERVGRREAVDLRYRTYEPAQLVAGRVEVRGPGGVLGGANSGIDVRGDGSVEAWRGSVRRRRLEPQDGESPYAALRRAIAPTT